MKYRIIPVSREQYMDVVLATNIIQVKKWYGWVTFKTIEGIEEYVDKYCENLLNILNLDALVDNRLS